MNKNDIFAPIPRVELPDTSEIPIVAMAEPLVCISDVFGDIMSFQPKYYERGLSGAIRKTYVRKTVADMLLAATRLLPAGYQLKILDAWRPAAVQKALFEEYYCRLCSDPQNAGKREAEIKKLTLQFVSYPSEDPDCPFVHATGGAVDLTIVDAQGKELNMGTAFDDFTDAAHTTFFENSTHHEIRDNRRMLYNIMCAAGFTNYPAEWWHYDFGDRFWAAAQKKDSIYGGIYEEPTI